MTTQISLRRTTQTLALTIISGAAVFGPLSAQAAPTPTPTPSSSSVTATPTPKPTPVVTPYVPKNLTGKCIFPSDRIIANSVTESIKVDLSNRHIARPSVRVKLNLIKPAPTPVPINLSNLSFDVVASGGSAAPLEYNIIGARNANQAIEFQCTQQRIMDITVAATINGTKTSSSQHVQVYVRGALK